MRPVTHRSVLAIAAPMTLAHLTTPLLGLVATTVVGRLGDAAALGGVALGAVVFDFLFWGFGFLRMGTVGLVAQALGRRDGIEQKAVLARAVLLAVACGLVLVLLQKPIGYLALKMAGASPAVDTALATYYGVRIWAAPMSLANYALLGWLTGLGRTGHALVLQAGINGLNIVLCALLVLWFDEGVAGAAEAAVWAEGVGMLAGLLLCARLIGFRFEVPRSVVLERARMMEMMALNRDILIRSAALLGGLAFFAAQGARMGDTTLAANALLNTMSMLTVYFLDGFATAAEQLCGAAAGARDRTTFSAALRLVFLWGYGFALAAAGLLFGSGPWVLQLMSTNAEVVAEAIAYLPFAALVPLAGVAAYAYDGIYVGAMWSRDMRNLMLASLAVYLLAWFVLRPFGNAGLWMALLVFLMARGGFQALRLPALVRRTFPA
ncbi:MATE family efflux transporter [Azorhizobium oxalatiphilum]|uniref:MATE family efflux transporter n=1 Tax=Azorhizobium oxalatiphilum TaxID=980631 RepID=UPI001FCEDE68|nr:MATE family efflux transporter [Azorhizobium oxalatiphilum]